MVNNPARNSGTQSQILDKELGNNFYKKVCCLEIFAANPGTHYLSQLHGIKKRYDKIMEQEKRTKRLYESNCGGGLPADLVRSSIDTTQIDPEDRPSCWV